MLYSWLIVIAVDPDLLPVDPVIVFTQMIIRAVDRDWTRLLDD